MAQVLLHRRVSRAHVLGIRRQVLLRQRPYLLVGQFQLVHACQEFVKALARGVHLGKLFAIMLFHGALLAFPVGYRFRCRPIEPYA